ncbi:MAG: HAD-IC family P-type ATPase [Candidatus ainarchaeum sp.]|nr:HAD-IC family P-type ATPase [Candidatus ainarchaeum sp.]
MPFHSIEIKNILKQLDSNEKYGLSSKEVELRQKKYGLNIISGKHRRTKIDIFLSQFKNFILILLILAAVLSFFIGHIIDAIGITIAILLSVTFGFILEYKADESMRALQAIQAPRALVLRNGKNEVIDALHLVPGDIIYLEEGEKIPTDCRILYSSDLEVNESTLTGESIPVFKNNMIIPENKILSERSNMVYAGTFVTKGTGTAIVVSIGNETELGAIASKLSEIQSEETLLQRAMDSLGKKISIFSILAIAFLVLIGFAQGRELTSLFVLAISLAVATVPEGLITVLTIILALGIKRMADKNALVRKMNIVETLGNASTLVVDKTGTITLGKLTLSKIYQDGKIFSSSEAHDTKLLEYSVLCNSAKIIDSGYVGDELDKEILNFANNKNIPIEKIKSKKPLAFYPLDSERKMMSTIFQLGRKKISIVKGAPEKILSRCTKIENDGKVFVLDDNEKIKVNLSLEELTNKGMRVIAVAHKELSNLTSNDAERDLIFLGFLAFIDPPRAEVDQTIKIAKNAGINVIMLTGDNLKTAFEIGKSVNLISDAQHAISWGEIENFSDEKLSSILDSVKIIARATPSSKLRIVELLIKKGEIVVVSGDGVNDALALKKSHVGVVMGSGSDVSKEAGDLVLLDDNISTLITAINYGRTIFNNILNFIRFQFSTNLALLIIFFASFFSGLPNLLTPLQILFVNIIMDGPPAIALGFEKPAKETIKEKPRKGKEIFSKNLALSIFSTSIFMAAISL